MPTAKSKARFKAEVKAWALQEGWVCLGRKVWHKAGAGQRTFESLTELFKQRST